MSTRRAITISLQQLLQLHLRVQSKGLVGLAHRIARVLITMAVETRQIERKNRTGRGNLWMLILLKFARFRRSWPLLFVWLSNMIGTQLSACKDSGCRREPSLGEATALI